MNNEIPERGALTSIKSQDLMTFFFGYNSIAFINK